MISLSKPDVILTHESDLDGLVSGLLLQRLAQKLFGDTVPLEAWNYNGWKQRSPVEKAAWVCDLSFEARLDKPNWLIIDHHATELKPKQATLVHDVGKSASLLCYELCREHGLASPALDRLVELSNIADLFLEDQADFALANDYANIVKTYQFWNVHELLGGELERLLDHPLLEVMAVKRRVEDPLGYAWSKVNVTRISASVGMVETVIGNVNLIVHRLLEEAATPYPVLLTLFAKANRTVIVSVRSRNGEALGIAVKLQGGGHANAAGATLPRSVQSVADGIIYLQGLLDSPAKREAPLNNLGSLLDAVNLAPPK